jgi:hypothetical protein
MRVFICGIIQGSISHFAVHEQAYRIRLRNLVGEYLPEAAIYCPVSLHPESLLYDEARAFSVFEESVEAARTSQLLVAYLPEASMGSAIEMWEAKKAGVKVVAITTLEHNWVVKYTADIIVKTIEEFEGLLKDSTIKRLVSSTH